MKNYAKNNHFASVGKMIEASQRKLIEEYSDIVINVTASERWNYALPENYLNFQDGFLWQVVEGHRGMPIVSFHGETLYLRCAFDCFGAMFEGLSECLLLFDRQGIKYCFKVHDDGASTNRSYWEFIKRVKPYTPSRRALYERRHRNA